jgi:predicted nuclease with TOPRIM domain
MTVTNDKLQELIDATILLMNARREHERIAAQVDTLKAETARLVEVRDRLKTEVEGLHQQHREIEASLESMRREKASLIDKLEGGIASFRRGDKDKAITIIPA